jgi:putative hydroxymethylpyrimidine transport system substrate-binding protein
LRRLLPALAALAAVCALAAGCGEKEESLEPGAPEPIEVMLDFFPNADHAPIYAAEAAGHFDDVGLDVEIREPPDPAAPLKQVDASTWRSRTSRRCCGRGTRGWRSRPSARSCRRR